MGLHFSLSSALIKQASVYVSVENNFVEKSLDFHPILDILPAISFRAIAMMIKRSLNFADRMIKRSVNLIFALQIYILVEKRKTFF